MRVIVQDEVSSTYTIYSLLLQLVCVPAKMNLYISLHIKIMCDCPYLHYILYYNVDIFMNKISFNLYQLKLRRASEISRVEMWKMLTP